MLVAVGCLLAVLFVLAACGSGPSTGTAPPPHAPPAGKLRVDEVEIDSKAVGRELDVSVLEPTERSAAKRPLLVFLHGAGGSNTSFIANRAVLSGLTRLGAKAPVVAFPDGERSWWHNRASGDWERYVMREVIPAVRRRFGTDPRRVAVGGISMGGYGAYHLGLRHPGSFCAVGGHSSGLWLDESEEFEGAFDNRADYLRNDVLAEVRATRTPSATPGSGTTTATKTGSSPATPPSCRRCARGTRTSPPTSGPAATTTPTGTPTGPSTCGSTPTRARRLLRDRGRGRSGVLVERRVSPPLADRLDVCMDPRPWPSYTAKVSFSD